MNNTNLFLGLQALGGRLYRVRAIEHWITTKDGRKSEEWCRNNWHRVREAILPESRLENEWWRFGDDPNGGRKYVLAEESWVFRDHSDADVKITGIIPALVYARGNEVLRELAECAKVTEVFNFPYGIIAPLSDAVIKNSEKYDKDAEGVWYWRDLDGQIIYKRVRRASEDGKSFVTLGQTCGHWELENGEKVRVEGKQIGKAKMIKGCFPWYGMEKLIERWSQLKGILIVEGEKCCDKGQEWLDQTATERDDVEKGWITLSPGPSGHYGNVDMTLLDKLNFRKIDIIIWPDADSTGLKSAHKLQVREKSTGTIRCWNKVVEEGEHPKGWDVADIKSKEEFLGTWSRIQNESITRVEEIRNKNTLEIPDHGIGYIKYTTQFLDLRTLETMSGQALDMTLRNVTGKSRPSVTFPEQEDTPHIDDLYGFNHEEGRLYRDEDSKVCINRFNPLPFEAMPESEISDSELEQEVEWFTDHMEYLIAEDTTRESFMRWLAFNIQKPGVKLHHALILQGIQGTGKSFLGRCMKLLLDKNCAIMQAAELQRKWNSFFADVSLIVAEELMKGGRDAKEFSNHVKHLITGDYLDLEEKYQVTKKGIRNHVNLIFLTNYEDSIEIDDAEDRYLVHFSSAKPLDKEYYRYIHEQLENRDAMQKLYTWFCRIDLRNYEPGTRAPSTSSLLRLKVEGKVNWQAHLDHLIESAISPFEEGHTSVSVQPLTLQLSTALGQRNLNRTPVRNYLRKKGYFSTPANSYVMMPEHVAKVAGIVEEEKEPDIDKLIAVIKDTTPTAKELSSIIKEVYGGVWNKQKVTAKLYTRGWSNKVFYDEGRNVRKWYYKGD